MRPLKLELQGFTAFRERQDVPLADFDLFTITGPTGAGKTSMLDAMIYALYGAVPRVGSRGLGDLVSQGLAEARISLEFAIDGARYRVARRLRRDGRGSSAMFERAEGDGWITDFEGSGVKAVERRVQEVLKLDFDAFTRAVVLPQGEFQRFLRGEPDKRREVLTDLLGLEHFLTMGHRARSRAKNLEVEVETTLNILNEQYADATPQHLEEAKAAYEFAKGRAKVLAGAVATAAELDGEALGLRNGREELQRQAEALDETRAQLTDELDACQQMRQREDELDKVAAAAKERCELARTQAAAAQTKLNQLTAQHGTLEALAQAEGALKAHSQCQEDLTDREGRLADLSAEIEALKAEVQAAQRTASDLEKALQVARSKIEPAVRAAEAANTTAERAADRLSAAEGAVEELQAAQEEAERCTESLKAAAQARDDACAALQSAETESGELAREQMAATLAQRLKAGDPCPVCQRALEAAPEVDEHVAEAVAAAERQLEKAREKEKAASNAHARAEEANEDAQRRLKRAHDAVEMALAGVESLEALREHMSDARTRAEEREKELAAARQAVETATQAESDARVTAKTLATELAGKNAARGQLEKECQELRGRLAQAAEALRAHFRDGIPGDAAEQLDTRRKVVKDAGGAVEAAQREATEAQQELQEATEALGDLRQELSQLEAEISSLRTRCEAAHQAITATIAEVASTAEVAPLPLPVRARETHLGDLGDWCELAKRAVGAADGDCERALDRLNRQLAELAATHGVEVPDDVAPAKALKAAADSARDQRVRAEQTVEQVGKRLEQRDQLTKSIAKKQAEIQVLKILIAELRANRFIQFIVQQTLDLLGVRASEQLLRISSDRYSLVSHDGEFYVIDHVNADEQRSVKTLSGGETFLASLSLALALSQHVGELATEGLGAKLEAVFIDEGFDQLDPETLEDVIDALERLREGNLMVGVITHVPALAERIRVGLRVEKNGNQSRVLLATL